MYCLALEIRDRAGTLERYVVPEQEIARANAVLNAHGDEERVAKAAIDKARITGSAMQW